MRSCRVRQPQRELCPKLVRICIIIYLYKKIIGPHFNVLLVGVVCTWNINPDIIFICTYKKTYEAPH